MLKNNRVYKFIYNNLPRVVVTLEYQGNGNVLCWDFARNGYRTFKESKLSGEVRDVSSIARTFFPSSIRDLPQWRSARRFFNSKNFLSFEDS